MCRDLTAMRIGTRAFSSPSLPMRVGVWQLFGCEVGRGDADEMSERGFSW